MADNIQFNIVFEGKEYNLNSGAKAFIFHCGIDNEMHTEYSMDEMLKYVSFVYECYLKDENHTPLCYLADYIAENWGDVNSKSYKDVLSEFYMSL